jgi:hypothetical protein
MANFSTVATVASATYAATSTVKLPFTPKKLTVQNFSGAAIVYVSFDGTNDHVALIADVKSPSSVYTFDYAQGINQIWIRTAGGTSTTVQVISETP